MTHVHRETAAHGSRRRLLAVLGLTGSFLVVEVLGAMWTGSLALAADAGHMFTDVAGVGLALFAIWIAARPPTPEKTFGYYRVEILATVVNALLLLAVALAILVEAYQRLLAPLGVNLISAWLLHHGASASLNIRAAYLEVLSDAVTSFGVLLAAVMVTFTGWTATDPLVSGAIALFIVPRTWRLLRQAVNILLEGTPAHLELATVETAMREVAGVRRVHDLHVWTLTSGREAMSAHVVVADPSDSERLLDELHAVLHARFGIDHTTIQLDREPAVVVRLKSPSGLGGV